MIDESSKADWRFNRIFANQSTSAMSCRRLTEAGLGM